MTEAQFHRQVADYLAVALGGCAWWTTFPAGGGGYVRGAKLRSVGLKAGVPDVLVVDSGEVYWLELKTAKGAASTVQKSCHDELRRAGCPVAVVRTLEQVIAQLKAWGIALRSVEMAA